MAFEGQSSGLSSISGHSEENSSELNFSLSSSLLAGNSKNVRFDVRNEAALAAQDYRVAHATRKAIKAAGELHKTLGM